MWQGRCLMVEMGSRRTDQHLHPPGEVHYGLHDPMPATEHPPPPPPPSCCSSATVRLQGTTLRTPLS
jgi:hypothetical protein